MSTAMVLAFVCGFVVGGYTSFKVFCWIKQKPPVAKPSVREEYEDAAY